MRVSLYVPLFALLVVSSYVAPAAADGVDITRPGDPISLVNGIDDGDGNSGPPPVAEVVEHAIDDIGQKYLNFLDLASGFAVTPSANPTNLPVTGLRLYTANDAVSRDPASYEFFGRNIDSDPWELIAFGNLALPEGRNFGGDWNVIPPTGNLALHHQEVWFDNTTPYFHYQLIFPTLKDSAGANSMQIGEVELLVVPEPASVAMMLAGLMAVVGLAVRRR